MKKSLVVAMLGMLLFALAALPAWAQTVSAQVEGTVTESGKPLPKVNVRLTNKGNGKAFNIKTDKNGKFLLVGVPYGEYEVEVTSESGEKLFHQKTTQVAPGDTSSASVMKIDINETQSNSGQGGQNVQGAPSGQSGQGQQGASGQQQPKYTKEQIEEIKKQNAKAENTNGLIKQATDAMAAKNWQEAQAPLQQLITNDPNNWQYLSAMGDTYLNLQQFDQAVDAYQKGIQVIESNTADPRNAALSDPVKKKSGEAKMLTNQGNAYLKLHKNAEATAAFTKAASMDPNPGTAYFNLCATQYNTGNVEGALDACDKAIAADPNRADAYFIKGSLLIAGSKTESDGKVVAPPGTAEALNKYLELQPDGTHAADVKQMLAYIGSKVETTYKKKGK